MNCNNCGRENQHGSSFCVECGMPLEGATQNFIDQEINLTKAKYANTSLILGIIGTAISVICCCLWYITPFITIVLGVLGIVFGAKSLNSPSRTKAQWGLALSIIAIVITIAITLFIVIYYINNVEQIEEWLRKFSEEYNNSK